MDYDLGSHGESQRAGRLSSTGLCSLNTAGNQTGKDTTSETGEGQFDHRRRSSKVIYSTDQDYDFRDDRTLQAGPGES